METESGELIETGLKAEEKKVVMKMAAVGLPPVSIAAVLELSGERRFDFLMAASVPGSDVYNLIESGRATGIASPQIKLQEQAAAGNVEAIRSLQKLQEKNRFNELLAEIDDDEFVC